MGNDKAQPDLKDVEPGSDADVTPPATDALDINPEKSEEPKSGEKQNGE